MNTKYYYKPSLLPSVSQDDFSPEEFIVEDETQKQGDSFLHRRLLNEWLKKLDSFEEELGNEKVTIYGAANYFVHLYDKLEGKYKADPVKIQKLIFIAVLTYLYTYNKTFLPFGTKYICSGCGFKIDKVFSCIRSFISDGMESDVEITDESDIKKINEYKKSKIDFFDEYMFNNRITNVIKKVFLRFGNYSPYTIGRYLDELKTDEFISGREIPFFFYENELRLLLNNIESTQDNPVVNFIISYKKSDKDENN